MAKKLSAGAQLAAQRWANTTKAKRVKHTAMMAEARWADKPPVACKRCGRTWRTIREMQKCPCPKGKRGRPPKAR
jgi:predicted Zn-ribbon and HTH transcriptional regulator